MGWSYKLTFYDGDEQGIRTFYYEEHELSDALDDQKKLGGTITDRRNKQYVNVSRETWKEV